MGRSLLVSPLSIVRQLFTAVAARDMEKMVGLFAPDCEFRDIATSYVARGVDEFSAYMDKIWAGIPDFHVEDSNLLADRGVVAGELILGGNHVGEYLGVIPRSPREIRWPAACFYTVDPANSLIVRESYYYDLSLLKKVLGS